MSVLVGLLCFAAGAAFGGILGWLLARIEVRL